MTTNKSMWRHFVECCTINYTNYRGRASRREYWSFVLFAILLFIPVGILAVWLFMPSEEELMLMSASDRLAFNPISQALLLVYAVGLLLLPAAMTVLVRRFHDLGYSGWWAVGVYTLGIVTSIANQFLLELALSGQTGLYWLVVIMSTIVLPIVNLAVLVLCCLRGTKGDNAYGADPLAD